MILDRKRNLGFSLVSLLIVCLMLVGAVGPVAAQPALNGPESGPLPQEVIYSDVIGQATSAVPGFPGVSFSSFDRVFGSPNGNWIISADTDNPTTNDEVVIVNGVVKYFEGDPAGWTGGAENIGLTDTKMGINDAGEWVFSNNTSATTNDDYVVMVSPTDVYTIVAQEGSPIPQLPPAVWDDFVDTAVIAADGSVGLSADLIDGGPPSTEDEIMVFGPSVIAQEGVTVPTGQMGTEFWDNFDFEDYFVSTDGTHYILLGDLTGDTNFDDVAVVDGAVVVQEGIVLPGSGYVDPVDLSGIVGVWMAPNGDWFVRGNNDMTEQDWVYSNGAVLAERGAPIYAGATEVYTDGTGFLDTFFLHVGDSFGNYVIGGVSDNPDPFADGVLVVNDQAVVARQGDPIDLDNNGTFDDNAYINTFGNDDAFLDDAGNLYLVVTMMDDTNTGIGDAFITFDISSLLGGGNTPPTLMNVAATSPINENDSTTLTGDIDDLDEDPLELVVNWGDGATMTYTYPSGTTAFTETHQYLDDDPTATPTDIYGITLILDDGSGQTATGATSVTVNNVAPTVSVSADSTTVPLGTAINFTGVFSDVGTLDTHTFDWGFGDGNVASGTLTPTHTYTATGSYVVLLSVEDDDLGVGTDSITVTIENPPPTDVSLSSFGDGADSPGMILWLLPLLTLLAVVPVLVARRRKLNN